MANSCVSFHLIYLLSSFLILGAHGVSIKAYIHSNFTGLLWESNSTLRCTNIPQDKWDSMVFSIRTDTCFIAYWDKGCKSSFSEKHFPGDILLTYSEIGYIRSFQLCSEGEGGNQLNVDITTHLDSISGFSPDVLESYKNVCSCVNVPQHVQNVSDWSIDNHHNGLFLYNEPDCTEIKWNSTFIKAGHTGDSRDIWEHQKTDTVTQKTYKIQSFGPDPNSTYFLASCSNFHTRHTNERLQNLSNQISQLQVQIGNLERNQKKFESEKKEFRNFSTKLKSDLRKLFICCLSHLISYTFFT